MHFGLSGDRAGCYGSCWQRGAFSLVNKLAFITPENPLEIQLWSFLRGLAGWWQLHGWKRALLTKGFVFLYA